MHLLFPFALFGLLAAPALVAIYWLRNRSRVVPVSSLMLWLDQAEIQHGGVRWRRLQTPPLFYLELLALVLLALAAAGPQLRTSQSSQSLVVILDNSYSMLAGGEKSPRALALVRLGDELKSGNWYAAHFLIAGAAPVPLEAKSLSETLPLVEKEWNCRAPFADLESAINLASEMAGGRSALLVLTDHKPAIELPEGRVKWWAFGAPRGNIAFVNAARSNQSDSERLLLEIANFAAGPQNTQLQVSDEAGTELHRATLSLGPRETRRLTLRLDHVKNSSVIRCRVKDPTLEIDNVVTLVRAAEEPIRVQVSIQDDKLRPLVENVLQATKRTTLPLTPLPQGGSGEGAAELLVTDAGRGEDKVKRPHTWVLRFTAEKDAEAYLGPFIMDRAHPLNEGLSLNGVIWGAGKTGKAPGTPVISVGNIPLVSEVETAGGVHDIQVRLRPDLSTLLESPQWAILMWNLVQWRASQLDGMVRSNLRLGEPAILKIKAEGKELKITQPDTTTQLRTITGDQVIFATEEVGLYHVEAGEKVFRFGCNALHPDESDLKECITGEWGEWARQSDAASGLESLTWPLVLIVALLLTLHLWLARR